MLYLKGMFCRDLKGILRPTGSKSGLDLSNRVLTNTNLVFQIQGEKIFNKIIIIKIIILSIKPSITTTG
uniref:Uncharacterized protein n=1 Tax=Anguilla anguilla TaxID=7936 RepID=A0A0E9WEJ1_ANGAN